MVSLWSSTLLFTLCCLAPWVNAYDNFISQKMREDVYMLKKHFKTNDISLYGTPVFPLNLDNFEESEQRLLTFEILHVYDRILSDMQNCTQERDVKMSIMSVRHQMKDARTHYFQRREEALKKRLHEIWAVNTTDLTVQRKAVRELLPVFLAASRLGNRAVEKEERRRRRRHATRSRIPRP